MENSAVVSGEFQQAGITIFTACKLRTIPSFKGKNRKFLVGSGKPKKPYLE